MMERTPVVQEHEQRIEELEKQYAVLKRRIDALIWLSSADDDMDERKFFDPVFWRDKQDERAELLKDKQDADAEVRKVKEESTKQG